MLVRAISSTTEFNFWIAGEWPRTNRLFGGWNAASVRDRLMSLHGNQMHIPFQGVDPLRGDRSLLSYLISMVYKDFYVAAPALPPLDSQFSSNKCQIFFP